VVALKMVEMAVRVRLHQSQGHLSHGREVEAVAVGVTQMELVMVAQAGLEVVEMVETQLILAA